MPYKIGFTNVATPATTDAVTDNGVNLAYTLGLSATTGTGSGVDQAYTVTGTMALGQSGTCADRRRCMYQQRRDQQDPHDLRRLLSQQTSRCPA
jgi:hypothetical protein